MAINRENFKEGFSRLPPWLCQSCEGGTYSGLEKKKQIIETGPSKAAHAHEAWDPDWIVERFTYFLECNSCKEIAAVVGTTSNFLHQYYGPNDDADTHLATTLHPEHITPAPLVFALPKKTPRQIADEVKRAFSLLWSDHEACASRIRTCIELLLDDIKISKTRMTNEGKERELSLHKRIEKYSEIDKESADLLLAVKWIGNAGSHSNTAGLERNDILDVFEILDFVLEQNYVGQRKRLATLAAAINDAKGKPKK